MFTVNIAEIEMDNFNSREWHRFHDFRPALGVGFIYVVFKLVPV